MKQKLLKFFFVAVLVSSQIYAEKIIVVGAGLTGLTTAYRLMQNGYDVEAHEARQRAGGRVCTAYFTEGYNELGGQNIFDGGHGEHIRALADELGVPVVIYPIKRDLRCFDKGKTIHWAGLFHNLEKPTEQKRNDLVQCNNLDEVISNLVGTQKSLLRTMLEVRSAGYEGCDVKQLSMHYFNSFWSYYVNNYQDAQLDEDKNYQFCTVKNGMCNLVEALCKEIESCITYKSALTKICRDQKNGFILECGDRKIHAKKIVLTLPYSTLKDVEIEPDIFPEDQLEFIKNLQYGTNAKILIPTKGTSSLQCGFNGYCFTMYEQHILWCYFGGSNGIFDSTTKEGATEFFKKHRESLIKLYPDLTLDENISSVTFTDKPYIKTNHAVAISWINEPYSKGSYSCLAPGQEIEYEKTVIDCGQKIRKPFRSIEKSIFIAGEHAAFEASTMEGAVESGERAAKMVIHSLR